jgi:hypothetical protein
VSPAALQRGFSLARPSSICLGVLLTPWASFRIVALMVVR